MFCSLLVSVPVPSMLLGVAAPQGNGCGVGCTRGAESLAQKLLG